MKTYQFTTLGCKVNRYESEALAEELEGQGWRPAKNGETADLCVINTCTVTGKAAMQSRQAVRKTIRDHPDAVVMATGCYAQVGSHSLSKIEGLDCIIGHADKHRIPELIDGYSQGLPEKCVVADMTGPLPFTDLPLTRFGTRTRAFVKIQDGCDAFCSYCIVPYARGRSRSLAAPKVMDRIETLLGNDYREIVLTGIHIGRYGQDLTPKTSLAQLLQDLDRMATTARFRLSSIEPMELTEEIIQMVAASDRICCHFHIPLQSGNDQVLKAMNRPYCAQDYRERIRLLVDVIPQVSIGVDVMAGFPGETDQSFEDTVRLLEELPVAYLHVFPFSLHKRTAAEGLGGHVSPQVVKSRCERLRRLGQEKRHHFYEGFVGTTQEVLIEGRRDLRSGCLKGFTGNYIPVLLKGGDHLYHQVVSVQIEKSDNGRVWGSLSR